MKKQTSSSSGGELDLLEDRYRYAFDQRKIIRVCTVSKGTFGIVEKWRFIDQANKYVAVKKLFFREENDLTSARMSLKEILHEVEIQKKIKHKNVLFCYGMFVLHEEKIACIVSEFCQKGDLFEFLKNNSLLPIDKTELLLQICDGIIELHKKKICHRDLKPQNILIGNDGCVKIADFGQSKNLDSVGNTQAGSPSYISPERLFSSRKTKYDHLMGDVYAFSLIAYQIMSQRVPFLDIFRKADNQFDFLFRIHAYGPYQGNKPIRPSFDGVDVFDESIKNVITQAWDPDPNKRPKLESIKKTIEDARSSFYALSSHSSLDKTFKKYNNSFSFGEISDNSSFDSDILNLETFKEFNLEERWERVKGSFYFAAIGDSIGYKNGFFEYCQEGKQIIETVEKLGGLKKIDLKNWKISDDTILSIATAKSLVEKTENNLDQIMSHLTNEYIKCIDEIPRRGMGKTCKAGIFQLKKTHWKKVRYNPGGGGCGASMRAYSIGLRFYGEKNRDMLIKVGIESGRCTHNNSTGFLGSLASSVFTAFAIEDKPVEKWGYIFLNEILPRAFKYLKECNRDDYTRIELDANYFISHFKLFLEDRKINCENPKPFLYKKKFLTNVEEREKYWIKFSYNGWPGASGDDSVILSYDSIMMGNGDYEKTLFYSTLHGGDSDSVGSITMAWFGAKYGMKDSIKFHRLHLEKKKDLKNLAKKFFELFHKPS